MKNDNWNDVLKVDPPQRTEILVWDDSCQKVRVMSAYPETSGNVDDCEECKGIINWYDENGFYDDSDPEITHWQSLPNKPGKSE